MRRNYPSERQRVAASQQSRLLKEHRTMKTAIKEALALLEKSESDAALERLKQAS